MDETTFSGSAQLAKRLTPMAKWRKFMAAFARFPQVTAPDDHIVTAREALESLYLRLEQQVEVRMLAAALSAGWSAQEALDAIDDLRKDDVKSASGHRQRQQSTARGSHTSL
jgi:hypothetical protein